VCTYSTVHGNAHRRQLCTKVQTKLRESPKLQLLHERRYVRTERKTRETQEIP
jgi:hypothetical protein